MEFESAEECKAARGRLATTQYKGKELIVDFVGEVFLAGIHCLIFFPNVVKAINMILGEQEQITEGES